MFLYFDIYHRELQRRFQRDFKENFKGASKVFQSASKGRFQRKVQRVFQIGFKDRFKGKGSKGSRGIQERSKFTEKLLLLSNGGLNVGIAQFTRWVGT